MADSKITALAALTTADPANDMFPVVDVSDTSMAASGTTKRISINNILACSPSATLASATITGAATVGTTLGVTGVSTLASVGVTGAATVGTTLGVTGVSTFAAGTALLPALTTTGDTNTGIYYPAADTFAVTTGGTERYRVDSSGNVAIGLTPANNKLQLAGNIGLPNVCMASGETNGVFTIDVANLFAQTGAIWTQCSLLLVYSGVDTNLGNSTVLQTIITLQGLATWNTISKNDVVGVASVAVSLDTTTSARITVTVPAGNFGSAYVMLLGGTGSTTRPSVTINA